VNIFRSFRLLAAFSHNQLLPTAISHHFRVPHAMDSHYVLPTSPRFHQA
jgi:hypothetical protein